MRELGVAESVTARVHVEAPGIGPEAAAREARYAVLGQIAERFSAEGGAPRAHPRRPGRDGAARAGARIGWSLAAGDEAGLRGLPSTPARRVSGGHRDRLPRPGHRVLERPTQRRGTVQPGARTHEGAAAARAGARTRGGGNAGPNRGPAASRHVVPRLGGRLGAGDGPGGRTACQRRRWNRWPTRSAAGCCGWLRWRRACRQPSSSTRTSSSSTGWSPTGTARSGSTSPVTCARSATTGCCLRAQFRIVQTLRPHSPLRATERLGLSGIGRGGRRRAGGGWSRGRGRCRVGYR